ncbi:39S ribosomal protein L16, mitochondrial [Pseudolycoriella hygida]|uniref:Large ribosomal subunit protein uL16m n=1 Tax=Pseudolycoriella hygida TaxID=35572 RepID=A0A9Q0S0D5_9DIPT|nr:39S ribosomal protein L16, mitochondrial [Pseudolycoriella hygida]
MFVIRRANLIKTAFFGQNCNQTAGMKNFPSPIKYENIEKYEKPKLRVLEKVPQYPANIRPPKMQKRLRLMRGPELVHNQLIHKQYGIIALGGGRMRHGLFEMIRMSIARKLDVNTMFAIWRVPAPWQPITKKGQGQRMGGGKGAIDHYVTPIKAGRVIVEVGGTCEFKEVSRFLNRIAKKCPFKAMAVSQEMMEQMAAEEARIERENINPYTKKYVIQNNLSGCHRWLSPFDHKWFGKHL